MSGTSGSTKGGEKGNDQMAPRRKRKLSAGAILDVPKRQGWQNSKKKDKPKREKKEVEPRDLRAQKRSWDKGSPEELLTSEDLKRGSSAYRSSRVLYRRVRTKDIWMKMEGGGLSLSWQLEKRADRRRRS